MASRRSMRVRPSASKRSSSTERISEPSCSFWLRFWALSLSSSSRWTRLAARWNRLTVDHSRSSRSGSRRVSRSVAINATLYDKLNFDFVADIAPVAALDRMPLLMLVNPALPARTVPEFIAYAKANPGRINMGSGGIGATGHVAGELFKMMAGVQMAHVPYRGEAPALTDLLGGQVQVVFSTVGSTIGYVKAGSLRTLAITAETRLDTLPGVAPLAEFLPGYEASNWAGIGAPANTPAEIIAKLNAEINAGLADPKLKAQFADMGATVLPGSPAD